MNSGRHGRWRPVPFRGPQWHFPSSSIWQWMLGSALVAFGGWKNASAMASVATILQIGVRSTFL
jgi:hypothetical protein